MNNFKALILVLGILLLSGKLFSQTISERDLIGTWKSDAEDNDTTQLIFFKDHTVMISHGNGKDMFLYSLGKTGNEQVMIFRQANGKDTVTVYTSIVRRINAKQFDFKELEPPTSDEWLKRALKDKTLRWQKFKNQDVFK